MEIIIWGLVFIVSLGALVKGADWLIEGAEKLGRSIGLSPFVIGAFIVGIGTSLPELASSISAVWQGSAEVVTANAVGSNIANILLVAGLSAVVGRKIVSTKNLIDLEVPLLVISTALFIGVAYDGVIHQIEAIIILFGFVVYMAYLLFSDDTKQEKQKSSSVDLADYGMLGLGVAAMATGAYFLIMAVTQLAAQLSISEGIIAASAVAVGTSLPEIVVSVTAVLKGKTDLAFGNVFGSNVFNLLMLVGVIGVFTPLPVDVQTQEIGLSFLAITTFIFLTSAASQKIHIWEGLMFLVFYLFFLIKLFTFV